MLSEKMESLKNYLEDEKNFMEILTRVRKKSYKFFQRDGKRDGSNQASSSMDWPFAQEFSVSISDGSPEESGIYRSDF